MGLVFGLRLAKSVFYVLTQAPLALLGGRYRVRFHTHRTVLSWHLRGCPAGVGIGRTLPEPGGPG